MDSLVLTEHRISLYGHLFILRYSSPFGEFTDFNLINWFDDIMEVLGDKSYS